MGRRSQIFLILATLPIVVPVVALFFIRDIGVLVLYVLGGWVLVAMLTLAVIKFAAVNFTDDEMMDAQRSERADR
jgi:hypothetical protein